jgi:hypothetical protein
MRGLDEDPFLHVTHRGEACFVAAAFEAASVKELETLAREENVSIAGSDSPGGGSVIRLRDPDGFEIEVVAGRTAATRSEAPAPAPTNNTHATLRLNALKRLSQGASACEAAWSLCAEREQLS